MRVWLSIVVGLIACGLLASAQCYTDCSLAAAAGPQAAMTQCPEHSHSSGQSHKACPYQHFRLFSPEPGPSLAVAGQTSAAAFHAEARRPDSVVLKCEWIKPDPAPPPDAGAFASLSILRI